jgi:hypothetical protein
MILFLNKRDLFAEKIEKNPLKVCLRAFASLLRLLRGISAVQFAGCVLTPLLLCSALCLCALKRVGVFLRDAEGFVLNSSSALLFLSPRGT